MAIRIEEKAGAHGSAWIRKVRHSRMLLAGIRANSDTDAM